MNLPTEADAILAAALREDARLHDLGRFDDIAEAWDPVYAELLPIQDLKERRIAIAFNFWDGWAHARNHDWNHYPGITRDDWPQLARGIADALERGADPANPTVVARFAPENQRSLRSRLVNWMSRIGRRTA